MTMSVVSLLPTSAVTSEKNAFEKAVESSWLKRT